MEDENRMWRTLKHLYISLAFLMFATIILQTGTVVHAAAPLAYLDFETSNIVPAGTDNSYKGYIIQLQGYKSYLQNWISTSMSYKGQKSFGAWLKTPPAPTTANWKDDPKWAKQRIEFEISNNNYHTQRMEDSRYYGFAVYIHHNSPDTIQKGAIFMQAWQRHVTSPGKHPPLSLRLEDDSAYKWSVNVSRDSTTEPEGAEEKIYISPSGLAKGVWHEFIVWFKPSVNSKGAVRVWRNGVLAVSQTSQRNFGYKPHSSSPAVYSDFAVRFGAYRQPVPGRTQDLILMFDQAKFGTSYDSVNP